LLLQKHPETNHPNPLLVQVAWFAFARLQQRLSDILGRPVDLVTPDALHKAMKNRILKKTIHAVEKWENSRERYPGSH